MVTTRETIAEFRARTGDPDIELSDESKYFMTQHARAVLLQAMELLQEIGTDPRFGLMPDELDTYDPDDPYIMVDARRRVLRLAWWMLNTRLKELDAETDIADADEDGYPHPLDCWKMPEQWGNELGLAAEGFL